MITKTRIGNHLRRHALGDQPTFRQGFKEGVEFALKRTQPKREWVGLNNDDWIRIYNHADKSVGRGAELAEEILKEKNT